MASEIFYFLPYTYVAPHPLTLRAVLFTADQELPYRRDEAVEKFEL